MLDPIAANFTVDRVEVNHVDLVTSFGERLREVLGAPNGGQIGHGV
jgi:hypothetical protein